MRCERQREFSSGFEYRAGVARLPERERAATDKMRVTSCTMILFTLICDLQVHGSSQPQACLPDDSPPGRFVDLLTTVVQAAEGAIQFLDHTQQEMILDGALGFVMFGAQVNASMRKTACTGNMTHVTQTCGRIERRLCLVQRKLSLLVPGAIQAAQTSNPSYYDNFEPMISSEFWSSSSPLTVETDQVTTRPPNGSTAVPIDCATESKCDYCFGLLLGTRRNEEQGPLERCTVSDTCLQMATLPGCTEYALSHQMLYFLMARQSGCADILDHKLKMVGALGDLSDWLHSLCSRMLNNNMVQFSSGEMNHDLFLENVGLCGMAGVQGAVRLEWLPAILNIQDPATGCFCRTDLQQPVKKRGREKRLDTRLSNGCSQHCTAVGVIALGAYIEHFMPQVCCAVKVA
uniref:UPF0764 protein C16orf89 homolog n=1 Tax=Myxine glutinosa TaxID=7769 RepID=UPI00358F78E4